jgi:hypothetical protein
MCDKHEHSADGELSAFAYRSDHLSIQCPTQRVLQAFFPRVKRPGREADHSCPSSAKIQTEWSYTSKRCLINTKDNFTFTG